MLRTLAICLTLAATPLAAVGPATTAADPLAPVNAALDSGDYTGALALLAPMNAANPGDADVLNLLGYASRKSGDLGAAETWYAAALAADPDHLGALEYQGELFIELGQIPDAQANLAHLASLCGGCEEQADLAKALTDAGA